MDAASNYEHEPRTVVITGCDVPGSYGYEVALLLDKQKYSVFAGCTDSNSIGARSLASRGSENLAILQVDVRNEEDIHDAVEMITDSVGEEGVWAVLNCSETYVIAEVDWCSIEDFKNVFDVNLMGTFRIIKALLPLVQKARGRIINLSSSYGFASRAGLSAYCASKFAVEALSDSLRQEMCKWGVRVSIVEPVFHPEPKEALTSEATSEVLSRVDDESRIKYGGDYFGSYIRATLDDIGAASRKPIALPKPLELSDKGYHTWKRDSGSGGGGDQLRQRSRTLPVGASLANDSDGASSTMCKSLMRTGAHDPTWKNRVLSALMHATTDQSPQIRYFVGSLGQDVYRRLYPFIPAVINDTMMTKGAISTVVPKHIKEKLD